MEESIAILLLASSDRLLRNRSIRAASPLEGVVLLIQTTEFNRYHKELFFHRSTANGLKRGFASTRKMSATMPFCSLPHTSRLATLSNQSVPEA